MKCGYMNYAKTGAVNIPSDTTCFSEKFIMRNVMKVLNHIRQQDIIQQKMYFDLIFKPLLIGDCILVILVRRYMNF